ncbi:MAG: hypothetical protein O7E49_00510 [Gemmatimonadetes bacterium]|nr:hypothetical protein [Gemmatimonadota bacterium]
MTLLDGLLGRGGGDVLERQEETRRIIRLLQDGLTPEDVAQDIVHHGVPARRAVLKVQRQGVHLFDPSPSPGTSG